MSHFEPNRKGFQTLSEGDYEQQYQSYHIDPSSNHNDDYYAPQQPYTLTPPSGKTRKRCCCCCCRSRTSKIVCGMITVLILIAIGIAAFFCWPRGMPKVEFLDPTFPTIAKTEKQLTEWLENPTSLNDLKIDIDTDLHFQVTNPNYISIKMKNITVVGDYKTPNGVAIQVGQGALAHSVSFRARGPTNFTLPFHLSFGAASSESREALVGLLQDCGFTKSASEEKIPLEYKAKLDITLISWTGFKPTISNTVKVACPIKPSTFGNIDEIRMILEGLINSESDGFTL
ncbi:hypothetical protein K493DRAFT_317906 [Basidiobolus meristosporus CBS 931.73]|uniref:Late embryogenesis abundant protein LEA-2 subgroup domain-containing protein n=1 Tax=Basidiobolus meristosporus CBS 931.73 TaxID=1314790 RepID=A0A1Y1XXZ6_9FUNG|nr:hypothetical protein K493DRAFT_317906 [Basidiobolus meristosporus CBS 931.73]|eukprot:ORX90525.1 hypothetical protein K493DRAFT_317906 [Basidiobolus meristosporus CBS 931.73]